MSQRVDSDSLDRYVNEILRESVWVLTDYAIGCKGFALLGI